MAEVVDVFRYEHRKPLVKPNHPHLRTMMQKLHHWYMETYRKSGKDSLLVGIKKEHDFPGVELLHVEFIELFQLYNQKALDKQLMTCYCL